jgi:Flp pilus assembly protein TadD
MDGTVLKRPFAKGSGMKEEESPQPTGLVPERAFKWVFLPLLLSLVLLHLLSTYWGAPFLWGIHHLYFFPRWVGWILAIVTIGSFIPPVNHFMLKLFESIFGALKKSIARIGKYPLFFAAGLLSIPLFWFLRTRLFLLGDGYFKLKALSGGLIMPTEWLDGILHQGFYKLLISASPGMDPSLSYTIPSVACGGAFIFLILILSDILGKTDFEKILIFCGSATLGSIELFFGYVESYTILSLCLTLFILLSILSLQGKTSLVFSCLALVLNIGLHVLAVVFVPSFLYLVYRKWRGGEGKLTDILTLLSLLGCLGMISLAIWKVFFLEGQGGGFSRFLPLLPSAEMNFTLFGRAHLGEFANQLLLISPVGTLSSVFFLWYPRKSKLLEDPALSFLLIASLSGLLLVFVYNCHWGSVDWDLMSFPGMFFTLFGILSFIKWGKGWSRFKNYGLILITVSFFHTIPWILLNGNGQMSADRYVLTAENDRHLLSAPGGGMWRIARALDEAGFAQRAEEILRGCIRRNPEEIGCYSYLSGILHSQGRDEEAISLLETALRLKPQSHEIRYTLGQLCLEKDLEKAIFHLAQVKAQYEHQPAFVTRLAKAYLKAERPEDAKSLVQEFLAQGQETATLRGLLGASFFLLKDFARARVEWERAQELNPDEPLAKAGLAELERMEEK